MSRSRKKTPVGGCCSASSEKDYKRIINKRIRRKTRRLLKEEEADDLVFPIADDVMNVWAMPKDGKMRVTAAEKPDCKLCKWFMRCAFNPRYQELCRSWWEYDMYRKFMRK